MPKNIDDVILPERRKSIRNIPIPEGRRKSDTAKSKVVSNEVPLPPPERAPIPPVSRPVPSDIIKVTVPPLPPPPQTVSRSSYEKPAMPNLENYLHKRSAKRRKLLISSVLIVFVLAFGVLTLFSDATLSYVPKSAALAFDNTTYDAYKTGADKLLYSVVKLSGDKGVVVAASGEQQVSRKSSGTIVVYNSATPEQKLVENTRFETPDGKIFRINKAITIPAKGNVEVTVYADVPGDSYNADLTDWTVPGLKGTSRFETIYARSKTKMIGGFVGAEKAVKSEDLTKAQSDLKATLGEELLSKAQAEVPGDFILFPSLSSVSFEELPQSVATGNNTTVNMRGQLYAIMFKKSDLAKNLALEQVSLSENEMVGLDSFDGLQVAFAGQVSNDLLSLSQISFKVSGSGKLLWQTDEVALKSDLAGKGKDEVTVILKNYPAISSATTTLRPFWRSSFPKDVEKISIQELKPQ